MDPRMIGILVALVGVALFVWPPYSFMKRFYPLSSLPTPTKARLHALLVISMGVFIIYLTRST
ncbi:MAG: hypothetical protein K0R39_4407 [Symbiobacteriaceae bacterium]|nr:hypothetical protein [Symbiobacteriaceae bacterium]